MTSAFVIAGTSLKPVDNDGAVTFVIKNFGLNTNGSFKGLKGAINWDPSNPSASLFDVTIDASTINTGIDMRDKDLQKEAYFDVEKYPTIHFVSTKVSTGNVTGNLTIKNVTKQISFPFTVKNSVNGYLFEGSFTINREDFGVGGNSMVLSDEATVKLKVQANP